MGMANPAELLFEIFNQWHNDKNSAKITRFGQGTGGFKTHRLAVRHLDAIEELLKRMENDGKRVSVFKKAFPSWVCTVFAYPNGWITNGSAKIDQVTRDHLETLIDHMDNYVPHVDDAKMADFSDYLARIEDALNDDSTLSRSVKDSALAVIRNIRGCIDDLAVIGEYEFKVAYDRLASVLVSVHQASQNKERWFNLAKEWVNPFVVGNLTGITSPLLLGLMPVN